MFDQHNNEDLQLIHRDIVKHAGLYLTLIRKLEKALKSTRANAMKQAG